MMRDGLTVTLNGTRHHALGQDVRVEAVGSGGAVAAGLNETTPIDAIGAPSLLDRSPPQTFQERFEIAYQAETTAFADFAVGRISEFDGAPATAAVEAIAVAEACEIAAAAHRAVDVELHSAPFSGHPS
jgi:myo-inositol 2-dehydrogenase/D-chiro-inositol 1-dehydrogenase